MRTASVPLRPALPARPHVLGITGSMAMGKSTIMKLFARQRGVVCSNADMVVHALLAAGGAAVMDVARHFPNAVRQNARGQAWIDRAALGAEVFGNARKLTLLEQLLHPRVLAAQAAVVRAARVQGKRVVVLEIPLLFEIAAEASVHAVWVASAPHWLQRQRALARAGMTPQKLRAALARQLPDAKKRVRADAIIPTGLGLATTQRAMQRARVAKLA